MALAAAVLLALVVGLIAGNLVGRTSVTQSQVACYTLTGHADLSGAGATVINLRDDGVALVDVTGLPQLEAGKVYEVWLISASGHPDAALVLVPDCNGSRFVLVDRSLAGYTDGGHGRAGARRRPRAEAAAAALWVVEMKKSAADFPRPTFTNDPTTLANG